MRHGLNANGERLTHGGRASIGVLLVTTPTWRESLPSSSGWTETTLPRPQRKKREQPSSPNGGGFGETSPALLAFSVPSSASLAGSWPSFSGWRDVVRWLAWIFVPPSPTAQPWPWAIGGALVAAAAMLVGIWLQSQPPPLPINIVEHRPVWVSDDIWRIETDVRSTDICEVAVTRRFSADGSFVRAPVRSYLDPQKPGDLPYLLPVGPGEGTAWYEYRLPASFAGTEYLIEVTAWGCENGFSGPVGRWVVQVERRGS